MHLILTGATGLVGSACLHAMLTTKAVTTVTVLSRRPVPQAEGQAKVQVILHTDFNEYPSEVLEKLKGADGCVWALGVSQNDVPNKDKYSEITKEYPLAAAKAFASLSDPFKFVYVSGTGHKSVPIIAALTQTHIGEGATTDPGMLTPMFGKVKGETEQALLDLSKTTPSLKPYSLRPAVVDPTHHPEIQPFIPRNGSFMVKTAQAALVPVLRAVMTNMVSPTKDLGQVLVDLATSDGKPLQGKGVLGEGRTISNVGMRRLAGL